MALLSVSCNKGGIIGGDPVGTMTVNLRNSDQYGTIVLETHESDGTGYNTYNGLLFLWLKQTNNLHPYVFNNGGSGEGIKASTSEAIVSLGAVHGLGSISTEKEPAAGWTFESAAVVGNGYILRYTIKWEGYEAKHYFGVYVEDTIVGTDGGILGYKVKYCPFTPGKGWNQ